jgi:hypothetical protein
MRIVLTTTLLALTMSAAAIEKDTIAINQNAIAKLITDKGVSTKGKEYTKYYAIINGELVSTSKTVVDKIQLCKKYGAKCALAAVRNKKTKSLIRIILN